MKTSAHTRAIAGRMVQAGEDFTQTLMDLHGITKDDAWKVLEVYRKARAVKLDAFHGRYSVKHGAFLDHDVVLRALDA